MIGIIFAMKEELNAFIQELKVINTYKIFDLVFYEVEFLDKKLILVESGIGKVNAARTTQILIDNMKIDYLFNVGVAGGISHELNVLDIVIADSLVQHDFDITEFNHPKGYIPNVGISIKCDEYLIKIATEVASKLNLKVKSGVIASGDIFVSNLTMSDKINKKFKAIATEMEGASIAQVAYLSNIPFLVIRSISDVVGTNNKITYESFLEESSREVANFLKNILKEINL
ncbi:MAG: 5'-methylthioadenosine/adenosylhomocysteine nucleosidase [Bacilli bacterium]|nr:5'-methylthioadenosine/adenosylhomocysteine nucleosidase [Bacilli bacterium]